MTSVFIAVSLNRNEKFSSSPRPPRARATEESGREKGSDGIVFGIGDIDEDLRDVVIKDLVSVSDEHIPFFSVSGNVGNGHRQFNVEMEFDGS